MSASATLVKTFASLPDATIGQPLKITARPSKAGQKVAQSQFRKDNHPDENFLYCHGKSVIIRNLQDPSTADIYTQHTANTTCARYSPSGFYIASTDAKGMIKIWDTVNPEHIQKAEYPALGRGINDLDWSPDSQKIAVCGDGSDKMAHVFTMDTGTSVGDMMGHSKKINTCAFRQERPFRIVTASEDFSIAFYQGPPFKFESSKKHKNFVNVARFSKDGAVILAGGSEGRLFKYDGKTCEELGEIGAPKAHDGSIYDLCFSPDDKLVLTVSGDKSAKIFEVESGNLVQKFGPVGKERPDMLLGCLWKDDYILTVNGRGHITYQSLETPEQPIRVIKGHNKPITALGVSQDRKQLFSAGLEGIVWWDVETGTCDAFGGKGHTNEVSDMAVDGDSIYSVGYDDTLRVSSASGHQFSGAETKMDSQPKSVDACNGSVVVACIKHVVVLDGTRKLSSTPMKDEPTSVSIHPSGSSVAVAFKEKKVRIYSLGGGDLKESKTIELENEATVVTYSPDGNYITVNSGSSVKIFDSNDYNMICTRQPHTARVTCMSWSPDSKLFATGGIDGCAVAWTEWKSNMTTLPQVRAHQPTYVNKVAWVSDSVFVTAGQDSNIKFFSVSYN